MPRRISERLGVELLGAYMLVNTVVKEEVAVGLASADDGTPLGKMNTRTNGLPLKLLTKSSDLFGGIVNRLYAKLIYANNRLTANLILKDIATSTKRLCTAFVYNSQGSNGVQNIISKLFKLLTKGRLAVRYAKTSLKA